LSNISLDFLNDLLKVIPEKQNMDEYKSIFSNIINEYHLEKYHSKILAYYLENNYAKKIFIEWINLNRKDNNKIDYNEYEDGQILLEDDNIDILLLSKDKKRAVFIENKSNNAADQKSQISVYYDKLTKREKPLTVEAIAYLNKNKNKEPELSPDEIEKILIIAQLVGKESLNSFEWVLNQVSNKADQNSNDGIRLKALSLEIKDLFYKIVYGEMNMENTEIFIQELLKNENLKNLKTAMDEYEKIPKYFAWYFNKFINDKVIFYRDKFKNIKYNFESREKTIYVSIENDNMKINVDITFNFKDVCILIKTNREKAEFLKKYVLQQNIINFTKKFANDDDQYHININLFDKDKINNEIKNNIEKTIDTLTEYFEKLQNDK